MAAADWAHRLDSFWDDRGSPKGESITVPGPAAASSCAETPQNNSRIPLRKKYFLDPDARGRDVPRVCRVSAACQWRASRPDVAASMRGLPLSRRKADLFLFFATAHRVCHGADQREAHSSPALPIESQTASAHRVCHGPTNGGNPLTRRLTIFPSDLLINRLAMLAVFLPIANAPCFHSHSVGASILRCQLESSNH